jgi:hypothetical protein
MTNPAAIHARFAARYERCTGEAGHVDVEPVTARAPGLVTLDLDSMAAEDAIISVLTSECGKGPWVRIARGILDAFRSVGAK